MKPEKPTINKYRIVYLLCLLLSMSSLIAALAFVINIYSKIDINVDLGNAGAFGAMLMIGVGCLGILSAAIFATLSGSISYLYSDTLPKKVIYSYWWSILLLTPAFLGIVTMLNIWLTNKV